MRWGRCSGHIPEDNHFDPVAVPRWRGGGRPGILRVRIQNLFGDLNGFQRVLAQCHLSLAPGDVPDVQHERFAGHLGFRPRTFLQPRMIHLDDPAAQRAIPTLQFLGVVALVLLNGFFVAAELALVKIRETQIETLMQQGNRRARILRGLVGNLESAISATQFGITTASPMLRCNAPLTAITSAALRYTSSTSARFVSDKRFCMTELACSVTM